MDAGADIREVTQWINATRAEGLVAEAMLRTTDVPARMTRDEVPDLVHRTASAAAVRVSPSDCRYDHRPHQQPGPCPEGVTPTSSASASTGSAGFDSKHP